MKYLHTFQLNDKQKSQIRDLWNQEYPVTVQHKTLADFELYLNKLSDQRHILIEDKYGNIKAWYFDFIRNQERWFAMIVDRELQGKGIGKALITKGKENNTALNGWIVNSLELLKANGEVYQALKGFYKKCGFQIFPEIEFEAATMKMIKIQWKKNSKSGITLNKRLS